MVQALTKTLTLEEFLKLPETQPAWEYIDGEIIQKPMPKGEHSTLQTDLATAINLILKKNKVARAYSELRCTFGGRSIVPDVSIFVWSRIPRTKTGQVANDFLISPDWLIEIVSPEQSQTKLINKISHALLNGCHMAWLIDPNEKTVLVFTAYSVQALEELEMELPVPEFAQDLHLTVGELFSWLME